MIARLLIILALAGADRPAPRRPRPKPELEPIGRLEHPAIREASGIVASRRHPGVFWVHNDSGNAPALFAVKADGALIREYGVGVPNVDWEDVAIDDAGHLYLGEIGNNGGRLPFRAIYRLDEPDPKRPAGGALRVTGAWFYRFPSSKERFDAEGLFIDGGRAVVVAKTFDGREAALYALPLDAPAPLTRPILPERVGTLPGFDSPATGAGLSPDGLRLAVCSYDVARVYARDDRTSGRWRPLGAARFEADGVEAITWEGDDLVLAGEGRGLYRIAASAWRAGAAADDHPDD